MGQAAQTQKWGVKEPQNPLEPTQTPLRFHVEKPPSAIDNFFARKTSKPLIALDSNPSKRNVVACLPERNRELVKDPVREKQHWLTVRHQY